MNSFPLNFGLQSAANTQPVKKQNYANDKSFDSLLSKKLGSSDKTQKNIKEYNVNKEPSSKLSNQENAVESSTKLAKEKEIPSTAAQEEKLIEENETVESAETSLEDIMKLIDKIVNVMMHISVNEDKLNVEAAQALQADLLQSIADLKQLLEEMNQNKFDSLTNLSPQLQEILKSKAEDFLTVLNKLSLAGDTGLENLNEAEMKNQLAYLMQEIETAFKLKDGKAAVNISTDVNNMDKNDVMESADETIQFTNRYEEKGITAALHTEEAEAAYQKNAKFEFIMPKAMNDFSNDKFAQELFAASNDKNSFADFVSAVKTDAATIAKPDFFNILEQVSEKVRVIVNDDVSEMQLQLKPDNLGKLSMKISIERGIVIAEFVAESRMVKEILESNMNLLKDALSEKGLSINELNVTVGDQSDFQEHQNLMSFGKKKGNSKVQQMDGSYSEEVESLKNASIKSMNSTAVDSLG